MEKTEDGWSPGINTAGYIVGPSLLLVWIILLIAFILFNEGGRLKTMCVLFSHDMDCSCPNGRRGMEASRSRITSLTRNIYRSVR